MSNNRVLQLYHRFQRYPFGDKLFSMFCARRAPYFKTIKPLITVLREHHCEVLVRKRSSVLNHIGTMHVIAVLNGLEMAMGFMAEASIPAHLRWIPKGMNVDYVGKAGSDIRCVAQCQPSAWQAGNLSVEIVAYDDENNEVVRGTTTLWISEKPKK